MKDVLVTVSIVFGAITFALICGILGWLVAGVIYTFIPWVYIVMWQMVFVWIGLSGVYRVCDKLEQMESRRCSKK